MLQTRTPVKATALLIATLVILPADGQTTRTETVGKLERIESPRPQVVEIEVSGSVVLSALQLRDPPRFVLDLAQTTAPSSGTLPIAPNASRDTMRSVRWGQFSSTPRVVTRVVVDLDSPGSLQTLERNQGDGHRLFRLIPVGSLEPDREWRTVPVEITIDPGRVGVDQAQTPSPRRPLVVATEPLGWDSQVSDQPKPAATPRRPILEADSTSGAETAGPEVASSEPAEAPASDLTVASQAVQVFSSEPDATGQTLLPAPLPVEAPAGAPAAVTTSTEQPSNVASSTSDAAEPPMELGTVPSPTETEADQQETVGAQGIWLMRTDGVRIDLDKPWRIEGRRVIYTSKRGVLSSIRMSNVDLEASSGQEP